MRRQTRTKLQMLDCRYPGLSHKVHAMFAELWSPSDVKHVIETHYGEHLSTTTLARYRRRQWQELFASVGR